MERADELDIALLRQMERELLLETVYDERRLSEAELKSLLKERSVRALGKIRRVLDEDTADEDFFSMHRSSSTAIHTAGDVIHHLSTTLVNHGSSR